MANQNRPLADLSHAELRQIIVDAEVEDRLVLRGIRDLLKEIALEVRTIRRLTERSLVRINP